MKLRYVASLAVVVLALGACKKKTPAEAPAPVTDAAAVSAAERARADSIAAAEAAARRKAEAEARARAAAIARARESLTEIVFFEYDSEQLSPQTEDKLRTKAEILRANPSIRLRVSGHADERGSTEYNLALGQRRAETVRSFLGGYGISADRLVTLSLGEERPLAPGSGEAAWAQNRRAEFEVVGGTVSTLPGGVR